MIALDASALLAFLFREKGGESVGDTLREAALSSVNLCEVLGRFARDGHDPHVAKDRIAATGIEVVTFSAEDAALAAKLVPATAPLGLSLGDRACLALAVSRGIPAVTADQEWADLDVGVEIRVIR